MNTTSDFRLLLLSLMFIASCNAYEMFGQTSVHNIYGALSRVDTSYSPYTFNRNGTIVQDELGEYHIQGIAYENGYYYIARSRPEGSNNEKLLVVNESTATVVNKLTLDASAIHPGGIQAHNGVLVIPFQITDQNAKLNFYSLSNPTSPVLLSSFTGSTDKGYCAGITDYNGKHLVAHYCGRGGTVRFYHFDQSFNKVAERTWRASDQEKGNWYPFTEWPSDTYNYENMSMLKVQESPTVTPVYYMIMYHSSNAADVYQLSDPNLTTDLDIQLIYRLELPPYDTGFRYGSGLAITDADNIRFFSTLKHVHDATNENIISMFNVLPTWPWKLPYSYDTGGQLSIAMDDNTNCIKMHRGRINGASQYKIFYKVGKTDYNTNKITWGGVYDTGMTGEFISVAMNNNGYCVEMHRGTGANSTQHYYRVGQMNISTKTITWGTEYNCGTGGDLSVAMADNNHIVVAYRGIIGGATANNHYYRIGTVNTGAKTITWKTGGNIYDTGGNISLAMDNNGNCLETHRGSPGGGNENNLFYKKGAVNFSTGLITWGSSVNYDTGGDGDIALGSNGNCIEVHRGSPGGSNAHRHYYKIGTFNFSNNTVNWSSTGRYGTGGILSVALDNNGNGIGVNVDENEYTLHYRTVKCSSSSSFKVSTSVQIPETASKRNISEKLTVYPNPAITGAHVELITSNTGDIFIYILDLTGRVVFQKALGYFQKGEQINDELVWNNKLTSGIYFVHVKEGRNIRETFRLSVR